MITIYIIGAPASGKTTLLNNIIKRCMQIEYHDQPIKHMTAITPHTDGSYKRILILGHDTKPFGGTDLLSYTAINKIRDELYPNLNTVDIVLGEGDRLATDQFIDTANQYGTTLLLHLNTPESIRQERATRRAIEHNIKPQNESWAKGRITKHNNLAERHNAITIPHTTSDNQIEFLWEIITNHTEGKNGQKTQTNTRNSRENSQSN